MIAPEDITVETKALYERGGQHVGMQPVLVTVRHVSGLSASVPTTASSRSQFKARNIACDMILAALTHQDFR